MEMSSTTSTVLSQIAQVVGWLPARDLARADVLSGFALIERHVDADCLSRVDLWNLQADIRRLTASPLRSLLNRRVAQLEEQYDREHPLASTSTTESAPGRHAVLDGRTTA
jgi:hypothetical protein